MDYKITRHIGLALLLPVLGSILAVAIFYWFLEQTEPGNAFINIAGRQRMLSQQLVTFTHMVHAGQDEDRDELRETISDFDKSLKTLELGGQIIGLKLPPPPAEITDDILTAKRLWLELKPSLYLIANKPIDDSEAMAAYHAFVTKGDYLTKVSNQIVQAYVARDAELRRSMLSYLVIFVALAMISLLIGIRVARRYTVERQDAEDKLLKARDELEKRVEERTTELVDARDKAELANHAKSDFLKSMSHELRTPLNAILGFSQLLDMDEDSPLNEEHHIFVQDIMKAGYHLLDLVNDVLDLAKIEAGQLQTKTEEINLVTLSGDCVKQVTCAMALNRKITLENRITDPDLIIAGDTRRVRQVLINLLSNAVKYNRDGGKVTIDSVSTPGGFVRIQVNDNGLGITGDELSKLFEPFERLTHKNSSIEGAGIGLYVSKQLVESMHGSIGAESIKDNGSTFWFELPRAEKSSAQTTTIDDQRLVSQDRNRGTRQSVLYIEDNLSNVQVVKQALKKCPNIDFLSAESAESGLIIAKTEQPDLILMDIMLPGIDGVTANNLLKEAETTKTIPVIAVSANAMPEDTALALSSGFEAYLTKPVNIENLLQIIDNILDQDQSTPAPKALDQVNAI